MPSSATVLGAFVEHARRRPDQDALLIGGRGDGRLVERCTYGELLGRAMQFAGGLRPARLRARTQLLLAGPPTIDLVALLLAALSGRVRVDLLDPAAERRDVAGALRAGRARVVVGPASALPARAPVPGLWRARRVLTAPPPGGLAALAGHGRADLGSPRSEDPAVAVFTVTRPGSVRGAIATHEILHARHLARGAAVPLLPGDVDLATSLLDVLHDLASGVTAVTAPAPTAGAKQLVPPAALALIRSHGVTTLSAPIESVLALAEAAVAAGEGPPALRQVALTDGPLGRAELRRLASTLPEAIGLAVYGAPGVGPIARATAREILAEGEESLARPLERLAGTPVGGIRVEVVDLPARLPRRAGAQWLAERRSRLGEVIVSGPSVSRRWVGGEPPAGRAIRLADGAVWQRTGDRGRWDSQHRLWILGPHEGLAGR